MGFIDETTYPYPEMNESNRESRCSICNGPISQYRLTLGCVCCSNECFRGLERRARAGRRRSSKRKGRGHIVYGWYHPGASLPFYIGMGRKVGRAWAVHADLACELERQEGAVVIIYRRCLPRKTAFLLEAVLIREFRRLGAPLTNR